MVPSYASLVIWLWYEVTITETSCQSLDFNRKHLAPDTPPNKFSSHKLDLTSWKWSTTTLCWEARKWQMPHRYGSSSSVWLLCMCRIRSVRSRLTSRQIRHASKPFSWHCHKKPRHTVQILVLLLITFSLRNFQRRKSNHSLNDTELLQTFKLRRRKGSIRCVGLSWENS